MCEGVAIIYMSLEGVLVYGYEQQLMEKFYSATLQFERIKYNTDKFPSPRFAWKSLETTENEWN